MEFPIGGQLRIENDLGNVTAESWSEKYVSVTASGEAGRSKLSSVVIENGNQGFTIRVRRRPGAQVSPIDLRVKFPESARVEIETGNGAVFLKGLPSSVTMKSLAGDLNVEIPELANANIVARTAKGSVKSQLPQALSENGHSLQTRLGNGARTPSSSRIRRRPSPPAEPPKALRSPGLCARRQPFPCRPRTGPRTRERGAGGARA